MTKDEEQKWKYLIKKYPERAGVAYELYLRHTKKNANITTYFMWAGKLERQEERRYNKGLQKYMLRQITKMECKDGK